MAGVLGSEHHDRAGLRGGEVAQAWGRFETEADCGLRLSHGRGVRTPYAGMTWSWSSAAATTIGMMRY